MGRTSICRYIGTGLLGESIRNVPIDHREVSKHLDSLRQQTGKEATAAPEAGMGRMGFAGVVASIDAPLGPNDQVGISLMPGAIRRA